MDPITQHKQTATRRELLQRGGLSLGSIALGSMLNRDLDAASAGSGAAQNPLAPQRPHFAPRAKNVIFMHMIGAPSQIDLFDPKPELMKRDGQLCPKDFIEGKKFAFIRGHPKLMGPQWGFRRCGKSGLEISDLLPHTQDVADDIAILRSLHTDQFNHAPAQLFFQTGFERFGRPSFGSWVSYGLGTENSDLPAFVVLNTGNIAGAGNSLWGSGFLPTIYQGVEFRSQGDPVLFLSDPEGIGRGDRRRIVDSVNKLNNDRLADVGDPEIATRIAQYEMAFRMQSSVPELMDIRSEPDSVHELYGTNPGKASFANNCLLARRLVERGVRFVQLYDSGWDHHGNISNRLPSKCKQVDRPAAALIKDLKARGLLDETLVVFAGEFGRTPMVQGGGKNGGRDHHRDAFGAWVAGGGVKPGSVYGATDDLGYHITESPMSVHDFHATMLHQLGMDHKQLTFRFQGREFRLTDVEGKVAEDLLV